MNRKVLRIALCVFFAMLFVASECVGVLAAGSAPAVEKYDGSQQFEVDQETHKKEGAVVTVKKTENEQEKVVAEVNVNASTGADVYVYTEILESQLNLLASNKTAASITLQASEQLGSTFKGYKIATAYDKNGNPTKYKTVKSLSGSEFAKYSALAEKNGKTLQFETVFTANTFKVSTGNATVVENGKSVTIKTDTVLKEYFADQVPEIDENAIADQQLAKYLAKYKKTDISELTAKQLKSYESAVKSAVKSANSARTKEINKKVSAYKKTLSKSSYNDPAMLSILAAAYKKAGYQVAGWTDAKGAIVTTSIGGNMYVSSAKSLKLTAVLKKIG